jgi:stalled ribosome rescue protein Dom34
VLGETAVVDALKAGAAVSILVSEAPPNVAEGRSVTAAALEDLASRSGAESIRISSATPEGSRFCHGLTGVAALLRWAWQPELETELAPDGSDEQSSSRQLIDCAETDDVDFM